MGKRTNDFQTLIAVIESQLASAGAVVTESKEVFDPQAGVTREVDIYIEATVGHHPVTVGIECIDHGRPGDTQWVEQQMHKHEDLGTSQLVLVSRSGFTKGAREKADKRKVRTLTLDQAAKLDWNFTIARLEPLVIRNIRPESIKLNLIFKETVPTCPVNQLVLVANDDEEIGPLQDEVVRCLRSQETIDALLGKSGLAPAESREYGLTLQMPDGSRAADPDGVQYALDRVQATLKLVIEDQMVPFQRFTYGGIDVASLTAEVAAGKFTLAVVGDPSGGAYLSGVLKPGSTKPEAIAGRHLVLGEVRSRGPRPETWKTT